MGAAVEQSSVFHLQGDRIEPAVLKAREDLLGTTSPTSLIYAALDGWRRQMVQYGKELLGVALSLVDSVRGRINELSGLKVLCEEFLGPRVAKSIDRLKVVIDVSGLGISGYQAADWLREHERVTVGLPDHRRIVAQFNHSDNCQARSSPSRSSTICAADSPRACTSGDPAEHRLCGQELRLAGRGHGV
jgi:arginine/lysine/ornithine decarboxylase